MIDPKTAKTIVVDLDRTLLHTDKSLSAYTVRVLEKCRNQGFQLMVATARPLRALGEFCREIRFDAMVVSNGARIIRQNTRTDFGIPPEHADRLLTALSSHPDLRITLETGDRAYSNVPFPDFETTLSPDLASVSRAEGALKILVGLDRKDILPLVERELGDDLYYTVAHGHLIQIMDKAATKWRGIEAMLALSGSSPAETVYFGDDWDDLEPIRRCGLGVAVGNAIDQVKSAADAITESNDTDGVAVFLDREILR